MSNDNTLSLVVAAAAGAFLYHLYAKTSIIEQALSEASEDGPSHAIPLSSLLDMVASAEEDDDEKSPMGFSATPGKIRRN